MKVLIVHDRKEIQDRVKALVERCIETRLQIETAEDYRTARDLLSNTIFDLLVIDLTLPFIRDDMPPAFQAAETLLRQIFDIGDLKIPGDIIGMTREPEVLKLVDSNFGPHLMITIAEDAHGEWEVLLADKVRYAARAAVTRSVSINQQFYYDALIVTAMDQELRPYDQYFDFQPVDYYDGAKEFLFRDSKGNERKGVAYSVGRSGQPAAASVTQSLLSMFRPQVALMSGYCGGVLDKVNFGDLVFFEAAYAWDYGKWVEQPKGKDQKESFFASRPNPIEIVGDKLHYVSRDMINSDFNKSPALLKRVGELSKGAITAFEMLISHVGSGSAVVANEKIISQIRGLDDSIWAVDMECYGFYFSAKHTHVVKPDFLCLKSVSDFCNGEKNDDFHDVCSEISAAAVYEILTSRWTFK